MRGELVNNEDLFKILIDKDKELEYLYDIAVAKNQFEAAIKLLAQQKLLDDIFKRVGIMSPEDLNN